MTEKSNDLVTPENLHLWEQLRRVDPAHSKEFQRAGGFRGTAIKPAVQERLMTEIFGPVGFGWGMTKPEYHEVVADKEIVVYCTVGAWYRWKGEKSDVFWGEGGDKIVTVRANGTVVVDDEARKKSLTDAIGNALKRIGMAADIHMGMWDDSKYRDENEKFFTVKGNPDLQPPAVEKFEADLKEKLDALPDLDALDDLWSSGINARIREIGTVDKAAQNRMISAFSQRKNEILKVNENGEAVKTAASPPKEGPKPQPQATPQTQGKASGFKPVEQRPADVDHQAPVVTAEMIKTFDAWFARKVTAAKQIDDLEAVWQDAESRIQAIGEVDPGAEDRLLKTYNDRMKIFSHNAPARQRRAG